MPGNLYKTSTSESMILLDKLLNNIRREFKKLLKENRKLKNSLEVSRDKPNKNFNVSKNNNQSRRFESNTNLNIENKWNDIEIEESDHQSEKNITRDSEAPRENNKHGEIISEIPEMFSADFNSDPEQEMSGELEVKSSLKSNDQIDKLEKSPIFCKRRMKSRKSQSPTTNFISASTPNENSRQKNFSDLSELFPVSIKHSNIRRSLSFPSKDETNKSTQLESCSKLDITKVYNIDTKILRNGKKLKQTKLIFRNDTQEITDVSNLDVSNKATTVHGTSDAIIDLTPQKEKKIIAETPVKLIHHYSANSSICSSKFVTSRKESNETFIPDMMDVSERIEKMEEQIETSEIVSEYSKSPKRMERNALIPEYHLNQITRELLRAKEYNEEMDNDSDTDFSLNSPQNSPLNQEFDKGCDLNQKIHKTIPRTVLEDETFFSPVDKKNRQLPRKMLNLLLTSKNVSIQKRKFERELTEQENNQVLELQDETFFSPGEFTNDNLCHGNKEKASNSRRPTCVVSPRKIVFSASNPDRIYERRTNFVYAIPPVRKKSERAKLNGWSCWGCKNYYESLDIPKEVLNDYMKQCSRHKAPHDPQCHTPPGFWNPGFTQTCVSSFQGTFK